MVDYLRPTDEELFKVCAYLLDLDLESSTDSYMRQYSDSTPRYRNAIWRTEKDDSRSSITS